MESIRRERNKLTAAWLGCASECLCQTALLCAVLSKSLVTCEQKLKLQSGETTREEKPPASEQSTPSSTPHSSPRQRSRGWFPSGSSTALPGPNPHTMDTGSGNDKNPADKWTLFGARPLQRSDSGFAVQAYKGAPKPSPMELMRAQATRGGEDSATFKPPKMDVPVVEGKKQPPRTHNLKPRDLNVLTPTGF